MNESVREDQAELIFGAVCDRADCSKERRRTLESVIELAVELAREGREGRKVGSLFVVGDTEAVLERSRELLLDPLFGHPPERKQVASPQFREAAKELAQLDGAFVVDDAGVFQASARFIDVDMSAATFLPGLGTRHAAAMSISAVTGAVAVAVSQSSVVRVFSRGRLRAEILPELFLMSRHRLVADRAQVSSFPHLGLTIALGDPELQPHERHRPE